MTLDEVMAILETRMTAENGNYTEKSFLFEMYKLLTELQERRDAE